LRGFKKGGGGAEPAKTAGGADGVFRSEIGKRRTAPKNPGDRRAKMTQFSKPPKPKPNFQKIAQRKNLKNRQISKPPKPRADLPKIARRKNRQIRKTSSLPSTTSGRNRKRPTPQVALVNPATGEP